MHPAVLIWFAASVLAAGQTFSPGKRLLCGCGHFEMVKVVSCCPRLLIAWVSITTHSSVVVDIGIIARGPRAF